LQGSRCTTVHPNGLPRFGIALAKRHGFVDGALAILLAIYERAWDEFVFFGPQGHERGTEVELFLARVQLVECALQFFKLLSSLAELAFRCQALVVGKVFGRFGDERVEISCGLGRCG
jgi:hypothetical protein